MAVSRCRWQELCDNVYVISSGEQMAIYAAMNPCLAMENFKRRGHNGLFGIIANKAMSTVKTRSHTLSEDLEFDSRNYRSTAWW